MKNNELNNKEMEKVNGGIYFFREGPVLEAPKTDGRAADCGVDISKDPAYHPVEKRSVVGSVPNVKFEKKRYI